MALESEKAEVERMRSMEVIEPSSGECASPVVMVPKPDGSVRFCIDYRKLNLMTVRDAYPIPRMDECIDSLGDAKVFSTLDCNASYWKIPVAEEDKHLTAFTCHTGAWQCVRLPFGLCNAPATFQRAMDMILAGVKWKTCLVYLDDVVVLAFNRGTLTAPRRGADPTREGGGHLKGVQVPLLPGGSGIPRSCNPIGVGTCPGEEPPGAAASPLSGDLNSYEELSGHLRRVPPLCS